tara:strand:+ start:1352 stop:1657 length:306 start_codon:yes stop_codon:yes gene_type:complete
MKFFFILPLYAAILIFLGSCETVGKKVDKATQKEEEKLSKFLNKTESELKIEFGKPDLIEVTDNQIKVLVYHDSKFKIKCERRFEISKRGKVVGFSSKNCF